MLTKKVKGSRECGSWRDTSFHIERKLISDSLMIIQTVNRFNYLAVKLSVALTSTVIYYG